MPLDGFESVVFRRPRLLRFWRPRTTIIEMRFRDEKLGPDPVTVEWITAPPQLAAGFIEQLRDN